MKNYLTAAALLAAGTAFANAATIVAPAASFDKLTGLSQTSGTYSFYNNTTVQPTFNEDGTATFSDGSDVLFLQVGASGRTVTLSSVTLTMTISNLQLGGNTGNTLNALFTSANTWGLAVGTDDTGTYLTGLWDNAVWSDSNNQKIYVDSSDSFVLSVCMDNTGGANGTSVYIDGVLASHINGLYSSSGTATQFCIGNNSAGDKGTNFTLENLYVHEQSLTAAEVKAFVSSIPEPSAFGLLAGVGALALVASRRRRNK